MIPALPTTSYANLSPPATLPARSSVASEAQEEASFSRRIERGEIEARSEQAEVKQQTAEPNSEEERRQIEQLKSRDREVRAHEAAHQAAAGGYARGGASFTYERGADGVNYAVGGEVSIDTSAVANDPEATLRKAETIRAAALAPAQPSGQDISVAAQATQMMSQARAEMANQRQEESDTGSAVPQEISAYRDSERGESKGLLWDGFA